MATKTASTRFLRDPSPAQIAAMAALAAVPDPDRVVAGALADHYRETYSKLAYHPPGRLTLAGGHACLRRLARGRCQRFSGTRFPESLCVELPGADHAELWLLDGRPYAYLSHPYGMGIDVMRQAIAVCDAWGLTMDVEAASWYYPLGTLCVEVRRKAGG
jgi:hypothetical protein